MRISSDETKSELPAPLVLWRLEGWGLRAGEVGVMWPEPGGQHWYRPWDLEEICSHLPALVSCPMEIIMPVSESYREENH